MPIEPHTRKLVDPKNLEAINRAIKRELSRDDIADLTMLALRQNFDDNVSVGLLLLRREHILESWRGFTLGQENRYSLIEDVAISLKEESVFKQTLETNRDYTKGPLQNPSQLEKSFQTAILSEGAGDLGIFPFVAGQRTLGFLYVEGKERFSDDDFVQFKKLANAISLGFKRLINASKR